MLKVNFIAVTVRYIWIFLKVAFHQLH